MFSATPRFAPVSCSPAAAGGMRPRARNRAASQLLRVWLRRSRERRELAAMGEQEWRDIGLTRADVMRETGKPFWR